VYRVQSVDSSKIYACKVINKAKLVSSEHQRKLISEIQLHRNLDHRNIVRFERQFEDEKSVYILLECCSNGSLMELSIRRTRLTEPEVRYFMKEILVAIQFLHSRSIIHRDLKLGNILLDRNLTVKICDFGLAAQLQFDSERKTTICGTPNYTAPEILNQRKSGEGHSYEVDIWAIGVIMFTLLTGKPPFETKNIKETYRRIKRIRYQWPLDSDRYISSQAKNLISQIFMKSPTERPDLKQMSDHPFFTKLPVPQSLPHSILKHIPSKEELFPDSNSAQKDNTGITSSSRSNSWNAGSSCSSSSSHCTKGSGTTSSTSSSSRPPLVTKEYNTKQRTNAFSDQNLKTKHQSKHRERDNLKKSTPSQSMNNNEHQEEDENMEKGSQQNGSGHKRKLSQRDHHYKMDGKEEQSKSLNEIHKQNEPQITSKSSSSTVKKTSTKHKGNKSSVLSIVRYVDYTQKYGLGYVLTNGTTGIYFNDETKMLLHQNRHNVIYVDNARESQQCSITNYPSCLRKKVILLKHFADYLWKPDPEQEEMNRELEALAAKIKGKEHIEIGNVDDKEMIHVTRTTSNQYCVLFKLSNNTVQVNFTDSSRIIIKGSTVIYRNRKGVTDECRLDRLFDSNRKDLKKRCKYTQQLLQKFTASDRE